VRDSVLINAQTGQVEFPQGSQRQCTVRVLGVVLLVFPVMMAVSGAKENRRPRSDKDFETAHSEGTNP
jgi:hypothetical protein